EEDAFDGVGDGFSGAGRVAGTGAGVAGRVGVVGRFGVRRVVSVGEGFRSARHLTADGSAAVRSAGVAFRSAGCYVRRSRESGLLAPPVAAEWRLDAIVRC